MDHIIVDATPKGSAILAYGQTRGPRWNWKLFAILAGSFFVAGVVTLFFLSNKLTLLMPRDRLAIVAIRPKTLASELSTDLRQSLPPPWRAAIETQSRFPAILGVSLGANDEPRAFALVARTSTVLPSVGLAVTESGLFSLLTGDEKTEPEIAPLQTVWSLQRKLRRHDAAWVIDGSLLRRSAGATGNDGQIPSLDDEISGAWDGGRGQIFIGSSEDENETAFDAPIFAILGNDLEASIQVTEALTSQGIDLRQIALPPSRIAVTAQTPGGLSVEWHDGLGEEDLLTLRSVLGLTERRETLLPDETGIRELVPSSATLTAPFLISADENTSSTWEVSDSALKGSGQILTETQPDPNCPGQVRFLLQAEAMQNLLATWNVPETWKKSLFRLRIVQAGSDINICLN